MDHMWFSYVSVFPRFNLVFYDFIALIWEKYVCHFLKLCTHKWIVTLHFEYKIIKYFGKGITVIEILALKPALTE